MAVDKRDRRRPRAQAAAGESRLHPARDQAAQLPPTGDLESGLQLPGLPGHAVRAPCHAAGILRRRRHRRLLQLQLQQRGICPMGRRVDAALCHGRPHRSVEHRSVRGRTDSQSRLPRGDRRLDAAAGRGGEHEGEEPQGLWTHPGTTPSSEPHRDALPLDPALGVDAESLLPGNPQPGSRQTLSRAAMGGRLHRAAGRGVERRAAGDPSAGGGRRRVGWVVSHPVVHGQRVHLCQLSATLQRRQPLLLQDPPTHLPRQGSHGSTDRRETGRATPSRAAPSVRN